MLETAAASVTKNSSCDASARVMWLTQTARQANSDKKVSTLVSHAKLPDVSPWTGSAKANQQRSLGNKFSEFHPHSTIHG